MRGAVACEGVDDPLRSLGHRLAGGIGAGVVLERGDRGVYRILGHLIDVLQRAIKELAHVAVDLANFPGAAVEELIDRLAADVQHRDAANQGDRDKGHQYKGQDQFVFYFHRDAHP